MWKDCRKAKGLLSSKLVDARTDEESVQGQKGCEGLWEIQHQIPKYLVLNPTSGITLGPHGTIFIHFRTTNQTSPFASFGKQCLLHIWKRLFISVEFEQAMSSKKESSECLNIICEKMMICKRESTRCCQLIFEFLNIIPRWFWRLQSLLHEILSID